ncbi:YhgE/Pip domain-containing protein [Robertmurraya korlensis]|uniref:YhgE/Pip family protein n=1 Tax=Robertmurraya korlensis TaxID=519977 RepID=UPI00203ECD06|nr:YhgE/Pip domain-containing protein [Robertmurraya korlensis]MCM3602306.1 YhgE/Pip domain-containing protein [Robertmurraya korlensis]
MKNNLLKEEITAVFRNRKLLIPLIAVLFIPILYSGMFLWAFWDPYDHLKDLPVAIVNEDDGATYEGKELHLGDDLVDKLKESKDFHFEFVDRTVANDDLENQKYYMIVEIPEDFSKNATTLLDENPEKLTLTYIPNEGYNFLAAQIGGTAIEKIKASLSAKVTETYAESMFDKVGELADGMTKASEGANDLSTGTANLLAGTSNFQEKLTQFSNGTERFSEGMTSATNGTIALNKGASDLSSGLGQLTDGQTELLTASKRIQSGLGSLHQGITDVNTGLETVNEKVPTLIGGTSELMKGAATLETSLAEWQKGAEAVNGGVKALTQSLQAVISQMPEGQERAVLEQTLASLDSNTKMLAEKSALLSAGASNLENGMGSLLAGQKELQGGLNQLEEGTDALVAGSSELSAGQTTFESGMEYFQQKLTLASNGAQKISEGTNGLVSGVTELSDASKTIASSASQLQEGSDKIVDGNNKLLDGSNELSTKLAEGADKASSVEATEKTFNMMAQPVEVKEKKVNEVSNYGTGFAPYFLSLGLFVGALLLSIVFPLKEPASIPKSGMNWFISKFSIIGVIGVLQGIVAATVLLLGLGLQVESTVYFYLFTIITSITFVALIQLLVTTLGDPGRFVAIIVLILQLTTSAGTFPLELIPSALQPFNSLLPMTYSVQGFKAVISSGDYSFMWHNAYILLSFAIVCAIGTILYFSKMHKRQFHIMAE